MEPRLEEHRMQHFRRECQDRLKEFRDWPGQHPKAFPDSDWRPFEFSQSKLCISAAGDGELDGEASKEEADIQSEARKDLDSEELNRLLALMPAEAMKAVVDHMKGLQEPGFLVEAV